VRKSEHSSVKNGYKLPKSVGIAYSDVKRSYFATESAYIAEKDAKIYAEAIAKYVSNLGIKVKLYPGNTDLIDKIRKDRPEVIINMVDTVKGSDYQSSLIPSLLEFLEIPYVGSDALSFSISTNKYLVSELFKTNGIPVPNSQYFGSANDFLNPQLRFPLISKLNETHGSIELSQDSISENEKHLRDRIKYLTSTYNESVIVEEFIVGREVSAVLLEGLNKKVYLGEKVFPQSDDKYQLITFDYKWFSQTEQAVKVQKYDDDVLREYVKKAFSVIGMFDYGKFDIKIDSSGRYYFIDANPNTFLGPGGTMREILDLYGISFEETLKRLLINTVRDWQGKERIPLGERPV
jgi:D-alanine-D-alanine ligase